MTYGNLRALPVYRKALDLCHMSRQIASYAALNSDLLKLCTSNSLRDHIADSLLTDSVLISKQIALAEGSKSYADRYRSVRYINIILKNIASYCTGLERDGMKEKEYLNLLRAEIKSFRTAFKEWRKSFNGRP